MLFLNPWLLAGLGVVAVPVIIHLARRSAAKPVDWGAMRFLLDTVAQRRRRMEWEELLLMAARCLLLALAALAVARPFLPPDSRVPWAFVLPAGLAGVALLGASFVPSSARWRWGTRLAGIGLLGVAAVLVVFERQLNLRRFDASGRRDVALVIDASASMELKRGGASVFERAVEEAKRLVAESPRGTAFAVILGGPAPEAVTAAPLTHRADVLGVLDSLKPVGGGFRAHEALGVATLALAEGTSPAKEIVVFTDAQRGGWRFDQPGAWDALEEAWGALAAKPKLMVRDFGAPAGFGNVALGEFSVSRRVVGTDREVVIRAVVENTGEKVLTPGPVSLEVDGVKAGEKPVGLLAVGQKAAVEFRHRFAAAGQRVVALRIGSGDDFPVDDGVERVVTVRRSLPVLLVDGNPSGSFFDRAAGYAALALAPAPGVIRGEAAGERHLMDPRVVAAAALEAEDFEEAAVIVLADVPRLPSALAGRLADRVAAGAGLVVLAGPRVEEDFYNGWTGVDGAILPGVLGGEGVDGEGVALAESTFAHEALGWVEKDSDLLTARVRRWRKVKELHEGAVRGAAFANGEVFLAGRSYGSGRTLLVGCALDARAGNLAARRGFVPLVHEMVAWCAGGGADLNVEAAWSPAVFLGSRSGGLSAGYRRKDERRGRVLLERVDPGIDFRWMDERPHRRVPRDNFAVSWRGKLVAPVTGEYVFSAEVDDRLAVKVGDGAVWKMGRGRGELGRVRLEAGKAVAFEADYEEDGGEAFVRLFWTSPGGQAQPVPASAFLPAEARAAEFEVLDPRGLARKASIRSGRRGDELAIEGSAVPGVYRVKAGEELVERFPGLEGGSLPVAVVRDEGEGRFEGWREGDVALVRKRADLLLPGSVEDLLGVLEGKGFGRQVGRWLVMAALAFLVLESLLARWVSRSRRIAEETPVAFGDLFEAKGGRG